MRRRLIDRLNRITLRALVYSHSPYQPIGDLKRASGERPDKAFEVRWRETEKAIRETRARNMLDIGCAEGFFVRQAATKCGIFALGLDTDRRRLRVGNALAELQGEEGYGLIAASVDPALLRCLPRFDIVLCFSVMHHIIRQQGLDAARAFLMAVADTTNHCMLFDMGSPEEMSNDWVKHLCFFKGDVLGRTSEFLQSAGFGTVHHVADSPGYIDSVSRPLFVCQPRR